MGGTKKKSTVSTSIKENILYINLYGTISKKDAERLYTDIRFCVSDLKPWFCIITDLTNCRIGHLSAIGTYQKIMSFLLENEVGPIARIVGKAKVIFKQMAKLSSGKKGYQTMMYASSMEEAKEVCWKKQSRRT